MAKSQERNVKWESVYLYGVLGAFVLVGCVVLTENDEEIIRITSTACELRISHLVLIAAFIYALVCVYRLSSIGREVDVIERDDRGVSR